MRTALALLAAAPLVFALPGFAQEKLIEPEPRQEEPEPAPTVDLGAVAKNLSGEAREVEARDVAALQFYADWCAQCRRLDPNLRAAADAFEDAEVDVVVLDFTEPGPVNIAAQRKKAEMVGAGEVFDKYEPKTGFVILVSDGKEVGRISAGMSVEEIEQQIFHAAG